MARSKADEWRTEDGLTVMSAWARAGLTDEQIASNMGCAASTLYEWKNKYPEIAEALKKSKDMADAEVENALYQKALSGDTTAMIFWLKNRKPKVWRDKQNVEMDINKPVVFAGDDEIAE